MTELNPAVPKFFFKAVFTRLQFAMQIVGRSWEGPLTSEVVLELASYLAEKIALSKAGYFSPVGHRALAQMLMQYVGRTASHDTLSEIAWRTAAGLDYMNDDRVPSLTFHVTQPAWQPFHVVSVFFHKVNEQQKLLITLELRVLAGIFSGLKFRQVLPYKFLVFKLAREVGSFGRDIPMPKEIAGYWLAGLLDTTNYEYPRITDYKVTSACQGHNRMLRRLRDEKCPRGYANACVACPVGYDDKAPNIDPCVSLTTDGAYWTFRPSHPKHYVIQKCFTCKADSLFDPELRTSLCVKCQDTILTKHRRMG